ncbi:hypothetical protein HF668_07040 [Acidithiobacillus ferridurans]|uniref:hypothetical protein n=1 Tax=Acidithiobacillus ferridurans TaxID=1232575 RepID=UPI001C07170D|nr:hypothetical protein [Acidithiobacillus ferridurans]MBU2804903.1 hypothetical protein [Acidithiobacillus ferridurans]
MASSLSRESVAYRPHSRTFAVAAHNARAATQGQSKVFVLYRDGVVLTFLFDRSTPIVDLMAMVSRAGTVRKVVL